MPCGEKSDLRGDSKGEPKMTKRTTKILAVLLSVFMLAGLLPVFTLPAAAAADVWDGTWDGSGFSNNHITSAKGLAQFINNCGTGTSYSGQTVYLDVDIDLNNIDYGNPSGGKTCITPAIIIFRARSTGRGIPSITSRCTTAITASVCSVPQRTPRSGT